MTDLRPATRDQQVIGEHLTQIKNIAPEIDGLDQLKFHWALEEVWRLLRESRKVKE